MAGPLRRGREGIVTCQKSRGCGRGRVVTGRTQVRETHGWPMDPEEGKSEISVRAGD